MLFSQPLELEPLVNGTLIVGALSILIRVFPADALDFGPLMGLINKIYNLYHHALG